MRRSVHRRGLRPPTQAHRTGTNSSPSGTLGAIQAPTAPAKRCFDETNCARSWPPSPRDPPPDRPLAEPEQLGELPPRRPQPATGRLELGEQASVSGFGVVAKQFEDPRPLPSRRLPQPPLPTRKSLGPHPPAPGEGSLRLPEIHPPLADLLPDRTGLARITPWHAARSASLEPQRGKRQ